MSVLSAVQVIFLFVCWSAVTLTQVSPLSTMVCPGQDLVYRCTSTVSANVLWLERRVLSDSSIMQSQAETLDEPINSTIPLGSFTVQVLLRTFDPTISVMSTATLNNALLSNNNANVICFAVGTIGSANATVSLAGYYIFHNYASIPINYE